MIYKSIRIKEGLFERAIDFSNGVNLVFSHKNSKGKTTLLRFLLYSLGYNIPNTRKIKFDRCEVETTIQCDNIGEIKLCRHNYNQIEASIRGEIQTYILPDQLFDLHKIIFGTDNKDLLNNILGAIYADQEKGWTLLNRGTAIGSIRFNIEELIRGLSDCDCSDLIQKEAKLSRELSKYRQMFSIAKYRESVISESGDLTADDYETETEAIVAQLLIRQKTLQAELKRVEKNIADNKRVKTYIGEMKLMVLAPDGETIIPVTENNIVGLSDTLDFLITKRKMIAGELQQVMHRLSFLQKEADAESEQLSFLQSESMIDIFDKKIASVPMNTFAVEREIKRLEKALKAIRQEITTKTKADGIMTGIYDEEKKVEKMYRAIGTYLMTPYGPQLNAPSYQKYGEKCGRLQTQRPGTFANGGIYLHATSFMVMAHCAYGKYDDALDLMQRILPNHPDNCDTRRTSEPYSVGNVYYGSEHTCHGENLYSWFSATPSWLIHDGFEGLLGVKADYKGLKITPHEIDGWQEYFVQKIFRGTTYRISFRKSIEKGIYVDGIKSDSNSIFSTNKECNVTVLF